MKFKTIKKIKYLSITGCWKANMEILPPHIGAWPHNVGYNTMGRGWTERLIIRGMGRKALR